MLIFFISVSLCLSLLPRAFLQSECAHNVYVITWFVKKATYSVLLVHWCKLICTAICQSFYHSHCISVLWRATLAPKLKHHVGKNVVFSWRRDVLLNYPLTYLSDSWTVAYCGVAFHLGTQFSLSFVILLHQGDVVTINVIVIPFYPVEITASSHGPWILLRWKKTHKRNETDH